MKRIVVCFLCFCLLAGLTACASSEADDWRKLPAPQKAQSQGEPGPEIAPRQVGVQVGPYREMELLPGVPGQNYAALYVRSDGTVDYIFCESVGRTYLEPGRFSHRENGVQYYTISPDGTARKQPDGWMDQLDAMLAAAPEGQDCGPIADVDGKLIIECLTKYGTEEALYLLEDGVLSQLPSVVQLSKDGGKLDLLSDSVSLAFDREQIYAVSLNDPTIYTCSYTGELLATSTLNDFESQQWAVACGGGTIWLNVGSGMEYRQIDLASGAVLQEKTMHTILTNPEGMWMADAFSPDGQSIYELYQPQGSQGGALTRSTADGTEDLSAGLARTSLLNRFQIDDRLAVSNDRTVYLFSRRTGTLRQFVYDPDAAVEPAQTLRVWTLHDSQAVRAAVWLWNETHSDVFCDYTVATENSDRSEAELIAELTDALKRGEGPDAVVLDGLPADALMEQGLFAPLTGLDVSDVYPNLLARYTKDGTLYAVPGRFIPWLIGAAEGSEPVRSLEGFADLVEAYSEPQHVQWDSYDEDARLAFYAKFADVVFEQWYPAWSEAIWADGSFHADVFETFLTQTGRLVRHYDLQTADTAAAERDAENDPYLIYTLRRLSNAVNGDNGIGWEIPYTLSPSSYEGGEFELFDFHNNLLTPVSPRAYTVMPTPGPDGIGAATVSSVLALRQGGQTELGLEFLRLLLSPEGQTATPNGIRSPMYQEGWAVTRAGTAARLQSFAAAPETQGTPLNDLTEVLCGLRVADMEQTKLEAAKNAALRYYEGKLTLSEAVAQAARDAHQGL